MRRRGTLRCSALHSLWQSCWLIVWHGSSCSLLHHFAQSTFFGLTLSGLIIFKPLCVFCFVFKYNVFLIDLDKAASSPNSVFIFWFRPFISLRLHQFRWYLCPADAHDALQIVSGKHAATRTWKTTKARRDFHVSPTDFAPIIKMIQRNTVQLFCVVASREKNKRFDFMVSNSPRSCVGYFKVVFFLWQKDVIKWFQPVNKPRRWFWPGMITDGFASCFSTSFPHEFSEGLRWQQLKAGFTVSY